MYRKKVIDNIYKNNSSVLERLGSKINAFNQRR